MVVVALQGSTPGFLPHPGLAQLPAGTASPYLLLSSGTPVPSWLRGRQISVVAACTWQSQQGLGLKVRPHLHLASFPL